MKVAREILAHAREETLIGWWQIDWDAAGAGVSRFRPDAGGVPVDCVAVRCLRSGGV